MNKKKYVQVRERSARSVAMSRPSRSSLSASTPDSLSDNESSLGGGRYTPRKPSYTPSRTGLTPGGSKPNSRPASRAGSKPPSRHGSSLSLDSTGKTSSRLLIPRNVDSNWFQLLTLADDATPSRIPQRRLGGSTTPGGSTPRPSRLSVGGGGSTITKVTGNDGISAFGSTISRPRTPSNTASPAPTRYFDLNPFRRNWWFEN